VAQKMKGSQQYGYLSELTGVAYVRQQK